MRNFVAAKAFCRQHEACEANFVYAERKSAQSPNEFMAFNQFKRAFHHLIIRSQCSHINRQLIDEREQIHLTFAQTTRGAM